MLETIIYSFKYEPDISNTSKNSRIKPFVYAGVSYYFSFNMNAMLYLKIRHTMHDKGGSNWAHINTIRD
jgi:hypothetical protein